MINKLKTQSRVTEVNSVAIRLDEAFKQSPLQNDQHLSRLFSSIANTSKQMTQSINRQTTDSQLEVFDAELDTHTRALFHLVKGYTYHPEMQISEAAEEVYQVLKTYGLKITREPNAIQGSLTLSLLADLSRPETITSLSYLSGCNQLVNQIKEANQNLKVSYVAYQREKSFESNEVTASDLKKQILDFINDQLVVYLRAMVLINNDEYGDFAGLIDQLIDANNKAVANRKESVMAE